MKWFRRYECRCKCDAPKDQVASARASDDCVPLHSPARALERSLTDPETRGEWEYQWIGTLDGYARYRNAGRNIDISRHYGWGPGFAINTPFTLSKAEMAIVAAALVVFDNRRQEKREAEAFSRLTASGIEAATANAPGGGNGFEETEAAPAF